MSLFDADPPPPVERHVHVRIVTKPWMRGWWFVLVMDDNPSAFGFTRMGVRRSRLAAIKLAQRWVAYLVRRNHPQP